MQVSIAQVTFPQPGRKFGKLQLNDGQTLWVPPELLGQFRGGMVAEVGTKQQTWGQGTDARQVTIVTTGPMQGGMLPQQATPYGQGYGQPTAQQAPQRPNTGFQPRVYEGGGRQKTDGEAKMIFVTGVVGRAMGSGKFTASEIAVLAQEAARTYDLVTAAKPPIPQQTDDPPPYPDGEPVA
jgi:hypothetical protein